MLRPLLLLALLAPGAATAADRRVAVGSFDRLRVEGPFDVRVTTGVSPGATLSGDRASIAAVELRTDGSTLIVRPGQLGEAARTGTGPIAVALATPALATLNVVGGSKVTVGRMKGQRVEVSLAGAGAASVAGADAEQLNVTVIGAGTVTISGGRVARARLVASGPGGLDAAAVDVGDLTAHLDGLGTIRANARYSAQASNTGLGTVTIAGHPKCQVAKGGGAVSCGTAAR